MSKQRNPAIWIAVLLLGLLLAYPLSIGPAWWLCSRASGEITNNQAGHYFLVVYAPLIRAYQNPQSRVGRMVDWYLKLWGSP